jgi:hypothetical protein
MAKVTGSIIILKVTILLKGNGFFSKEMLIILPQLQSQQRDKDHSHSKVTQSVLGKSLG